MSTCTDEEKRKLSKLLDGLEVPEIKLSERCSVLIKDFHKKFDKEIEEEHISEMEEEFAENPYKPPQQELEELTMKLKELLKKNHKSTKQEASVTAPVADPKRPWRTHSTNERLLRINNELKHHHERGTQGVAPLEDDVLKTLVRQGEEESRTSAAPAITANRLREVVESAKRNLPNFQYRKIENTTATEILPSAHTETREDATPLKPEPSV